MYNPWEPEDDLTKALADDANGAVSQGVMTGKMLVDRIWNRTTDFNRYDYSHLLSSQHRAAGLKLLIDHTHQGAVAANLYQGDEHVGHADSFVDGANINMDSAEIDPSHRGQGLATPLYHASLAHAAKHLGAKRWVGGNHSTSAHRVHGSLTKKLGLEYIGGAARPGLDHEPVHPHDGKFGPYEVPFDSQIQKAEEDLTKMLPGFKFPKLGVPDDRRETKINTGTQKLQTPTKPGQPKTMGDLQNKQSLKVMSNALSRDLPDSYPRANVDRAVTRAFDSSVSNGSTFGKNGTVASWAAGDERRGGDSMTNIGIPERRGGVERNPLQPASVTAMHENMHRIFARIRTRYGQQALANFTQNLVQSIPSSVRRAVETYGKQRAPKAQGDLHEEMIAHLISYLNDPGQRARFHAPHTPEQGRKFHTMMKRAYKHLQAASGVADEQWLQPNPWVNG